MEEPLQTIADILDFPEPGTAEHTQLRLRSYKNERAAGWGDNEVDLFDTACSLHAKGLIQIRWEGVEPLFELSESGANLCKHVQTSE
jgi:hypothetical protein